jgi:vacuolar-type H+-ATPase subunit I/STV1
MKPKYQISLDDAFDDYGFSAVSEEELKQHEKQLQQTLQQTAQHKQQVVETYEEKLGALYQLIMPLLINLQKNPEKEYILWPNRAEKIKEFIAKVDKIVQ